MMLGEIKRYLKVYRQSLVNNVAIEMSFRLNFFLIFVVEVIWLGVLLGTFYIVFEHIDFIGGWTRQEFFFFAALVSTFDNLFLALFAPNFWNFSEILRQGTLDFLLIKPVNSMFLVFSQYQRLAGMVASVFSAGVLIWFAQDLERVQWSADLWLVFVLLFVLGMALRLAIEIIVGTLMFITIEGEAINIFRINLQQFSKYPAFIYFNPLRLVLTRVLPLCLVTTLPVEWVLGDSSSGTILENMIWLIVLIIASWWLAHQIWAWGLSRYDSASS